MKNLQINFLFRLRTFNIGRPSTCRRVNPIHKQGQMLEKMIQNRDKRKAWHFEIFQNHAKSKNVFDKISRPSKRQTVLSSLFIKNISDVISTGEVPDILGLGIEITGVKIGPCCKVVNVYWQSCFTNPDDSFEDIGMILNQNAPKIRAELISRNILGYVPPIFFIRDMTDSYMAAFQKALSEADLGPENEKMIVPEDTFTNKKKLYKFEDAKPIKEKKFEEKPPPSPSPPAGAPSEPPRPPDMKSDVFGLKRDVLMSKVLATKCKSKVTESSHVILGPDWSSSDDLFSDIPGTSLHGESTRERLFRQFYVERKKMKLQAAKVGKNELEFSDSFEDPEEFECDAENEDFVEEDTNDRV